MGRKGRNGTQPHQPKPYLVAQLGNADGCRREEAHCRLTNTLQRRHALMAATSAFACPLFFFRRPALVGVRSPTPTGAWAAGGKSLRLRTPSDPLLSRPFYPGCPRWQQLAAVAADTYYQDLGEGSYRGGDEGVGEQRSVQAAARSGGTRAEETGRRLYVGNLPYSMTPSQLTQVFSEAGTVTSVEVVYDRLTDRSRGFAFVTMGSADESRTAIRLFDGAQVGGRTVKVNIPEVPRGGEREVMEPRVRESRRGFVDSPHRLYAGNLGWTVTSDSLRGAFTRCPGLIGARVVYERDTGRSRGYGFLSFASAEEARSALDAMDGVEVEGRPLRLNVSNNSGNAAPASGVGY